VATFFAFVLSAIEVIAIAVKNALLKPDAHPNKEQSSVTKQRLSADKPVRVEQQRIESDTVSPKNLHYQKKVTDTTSPLIPI
jgi:hypothetical protein